MSWGSQILNLRKESKDTHAGEREVKRALRESLFQYQPHLEQELFDRAYSYIRRYYWIGFTKNGHKPCNKFNAYVVVADYQGLVTMIVNRDPTPTADMVEKARLALKANIEWREKKGHVVRVLKGPYHENLRNIRLVY